MQVLEDPVVVRRDEEQRPEQFLWRSRLWSVREVLRRPSSRASDEPAGAEVWRVRAAAGRLSALLDAAGGRETSGGVVVDLTFDWVSGDWWLAEVER